VNIQLRREWVSAQLTRGHRPTAVAHMGAERFGVHPQTIMDDLAAIRDQWAAEAEAERPRAREEMLARIDAEVQGLVGPRNVAIAVASAEALSEEEIRERAAATLRRARERAVGGVGSPDGG
jgi:hypothetical protein